MALLREGQSKVDCSRVIFELHSHSPSLNQEFPSPCNHTQSYNRGLMLDSTIHPSKAVMDAVQLLDMMCYTSTVAIAVGVSKTMRTYRQRRLFKATLPFVVITILDHLCKYFVILICASYLSKHSAK